MEKFKISEAHVKDATAWAKEVAFDICQNDDERPRVYSAIMEGVRIAFLTVAENDGETEDMIKEWWEWK